MNPVANQPQPSSSHSLLVLRIPSICTLSFTQFLTKTDHGRVPIEIISTSASGMRNLFCCSCSDFIPGTSGFRKVQPALLFCPHLGKTHLAKVI